MTDWLVEAMFASTLLMVAVLAVRTRVALWFGPHAAYLLWLLPALRLILPPIPHAPAPIAAVPLPIDLGVVAETQLPPIDIAEQAPAIASEPIAWATILLVVWLAGAACYLVLQLLRHRRFMALAAESGRSGLRRGRIAILRSGAIGSPLAAGLFRPQILLPDDFMRRYSGAERRLALLHELAHHRRGDLFVNLLALLILSLHWFNPIAHWAYRAFRADQEQACDATVLDQRPACARAYGAALIKSALARRPAAACALGAAAGLKGRLRMIARQDRSITNRRIGAGLTASLVAGGLMLTASNSVAATTRILQVPTEPAAMVARYVAPVPAAAPTPPSAPAAPRATTPTRPAPAAPQAPAAPAAPATVDARAAADLAAASADIAAHAADLALAATETARARWSDEQTEAARREALAEARRELESECRYAAPARGPESDADAVQRLSTGCVDRHAIRAEVARGLRQAAADLRRDPSLPDHARERMTASFERAARRLESRHED
jgi:bla regulator protein blaR1